MGDDGRDQIAKRVDVEAWLPWMDSFSKIPKLEPLCEALPALGNVEHLAEATRAAATDWAAMFRKIASANELSLLGVEMAVMADKRRLDRTAPSFFNSYVTMFSEAEAASKLHEAYKACIERGLRDGGSKYRALYPIVVHSSLYKATTGYFHASIGTAPIPAAQPLTYQGEGELRASGYPIAYERSKASGDPGVVDKSVEAQVGDVAKILSDLQAVGSISELANATLVVLPFLRPEFSAPRPIPSDRSAMPGGCIFLLLRGQVAHDDADLRKFLGCVRWLLAEASANESQTAYEAIGRQRAFSAAMVHGTVSAIDAINLPNIVARLFHGERNKYAPLSSSDLIADFSAWGSPEAVAAHKEALIQDLNVSIAAQELAGSLVGFSEIHSDGGVLRKKFRSDADHGLLDLVNRAWSIAVASTNVDHRALVDVSADWTLPSGYVSHNLVIGLIMELFRNAIQHGMVKMPGSRVEVAIEDDRGGYGGFVRIRIANELPEDARPEPRQVGFLSRAQELLQDIDGIKMVLDDVDSRYTVFLKLGQIKGPDGSPGPHPHPRGESDR